MGPLFREGRHLRDKFCQSLGNNTVGSHVGFGHQRSVGLAFDHACWTG